MTRSAATAGVITAIALACAALLYLPGRTVTAAFVNDLMIFLDGANRIAFGQVPSRDFHTALGPLVFYIPAAGALAGGSLGAAMPSGMALLLIALAPAMARILASRFSSLTAVAIGLFLILLLAAPINVGGAVSALSFAMFYNRIGWVALGLLCLMYVRPRTETAAGNLADGIIAGLLVLLQLYLKITYGLAAIAFLLFMLTDRRQREWVQSALILTVLGALAIEIVWRGSFQYMADLGAASRVSGGRGMESLLRDIIGNLADLAVFALFAGLSVLRTRSLRDVAFYAACAGGGILILNQNAHSWGIITLHCAATVATERAVRTQGPAAPIPASTAPLAAGLPLLLVFYLLPPIVHTASALLLHAGLAASGAGMPLGLPRLHEVRFLEPPSDTPSFPARYVESLGHGGDLLGSLQPPPERVMVLDFANPFSAGLGLQPPAGDSAWLHWGRNVSEKSYITPELLFADVEIVMVPEIGINAAPLQSLYGAYIDRTFTPVMKTGEWTIYRRRGTETGKGRA